MSFGIYVHTPYCLQRCSYCDFATYEINTILPPEKYFSLLQSEVSQHARFFPAHELTSLYFGGGTPSLVDAHLITDFIATLNSFGFTLKNGSTECTIEINPATVSEEKLRQYLENGVSRFSVGAQTFKDSLLKSVNREHNSIDTLNTLALLRKYELNFSFDILFGLPGQSLSDLQMDLKIAMDQGAKHISPYCLTVPEGHPLAKIRPPEEEQLEMFQAIHECLIENNFLQYEISNYAQLGFESKHNQLYWQNEEYWGIGLSSHSYSKESTWGTRFWNESNIGLYESSIERSRGQEFSSPALCLPTTQREVLQMHQALTDFCHTSLRIREGLSLNKIRHLFGARCENLVRDLLEPLTARKLVVSAPPDRFVLTREGQMISNQIFEKFTFLKEDIA